MKRTLLTLLLYVSLAANALPQTVIDPARRAQTLEGWGTSLCWWANMVGRWTDERVLDSLLTLLVSPDHLGYNIFRYNIGGGDDPDWAHCTPHHFGGRGGKGLRAEMEGFLDARGGDYRWDRDSAQVRVLRKLHERNPGAIFEAFSNSAPWWMTVSGCAGGADKATDDNLREDFHEDFARYLVDVCRHFRDEYGIRFRTLEPFNEPETDYWRRDGSQEGCHFSARAQVEFLHTLAPLLAASGLDTQIAASDETSLLQGIRDFHFYRRDGEALRSVAQWNVHTYKGSDRERAEMRRLAKAHGKRLWMSESGDGGRGIHGNLMMAQRLISDMRLLRPVAWIDWQYVEERGDQWSLIESEWQRPQFRVHKNYWVRYQFSHFIRPGYTFIHTENSRLLAAVSPDGRRLVMVTLNTEWRAARTERLDVSAFTGGGGKAGLRVWRTSPTEDCAEIGADADFADGEIRLTLPPLSIATAVCELGAD